MVRQEQYGEESRDELTASANTSDRNQSKLSNIELVKTQDADNKRTLEPRIVLSVSSKSGLSEDTSLRPFDKQKASSKHHQDTQNTTVRGRNNEPHFAENHHSTFSPAQETSSLNTKS